MPRNVRNFWLKLAVDGKKTRVETGPVAKDGGFELTVLMRDAGGIATAGTLKGTAGDDGKIVLTWHAEPSWHGSVANSIYTPLAKAQR